MSVNLIRRVVAKATFPPHSPRLFLMTC